MRLPNIKLVVFLFCSLIFFSSCATRRGFSDGFFQNRNNRYQVTNPGAGWDEIRVRGADIAFFYPKDGSTLLVNSSCEGSSDAPLEALAGHLLLGLTEQNIIDQTRIPLADREALIQTATAKLDGVERSFKILVLKKDTCVFDIVLSSAASNFAEHTPTFNAIVERFTVEARRR